MKEGTCIWKHIKIPYTKVEPDRSATSGDLLEIDFNYSPYRAPNHVNLKSKLLSTKKIFYIDFLKLNDCDIFLEKYINELNILRNDIKKYKSIIQNQENLLLK